MTLDEAGKVSNQDIASFLGGLPEEKMHCSVMGREALEKAIAIYRGQTYHDDAEDEGKIVCKCFGVTDEKIKRVVREVAGGRILGGRRRGATGDQHRQACEQREDDPAHLSLPSASRYHAGSPRG